MNPFVSYIAQHPAVMADHHPLTEEEQDALFEALNDPKLPDDCMTAEMADGFLTGCALSPHKVDMADWLEEVFGQVSMPPCGGPEARDQLLSLLLRRWRDIQHAFMPEVAERVMNLGTEPMFTPLIGEVDAEEVVLPVQLDEEERRVGEWQGRDWAVGFFTAIQRDETWQHLLEDEEHWPMVAPVLTYFQGYEAGRDGYVLDQDTDAMANMVRALYRISAYWRTFNQALAKR
ncbi:MAG: UPF0149 family protein [Burkholderiales bacterium]|jgi:uncharacterized protein|nr:UPF0149 family protein [Burkholderiales bacterium]